MELVPKAVGEVSAWEGPGGPEKVPTVGSEEEPALITKDNSTLRLACQ